MSGLIGTSNKIEMSVPEEDRIAIWSKLLPFGRLAILLEAHDSHWFVVLVADRRCQLF